MTRKSQILLVTHALALTLGYGLVRRAAEGARGGDSPEYTKLAARDAEVPAGDGNDLLADFLNERAGRNSRYAELKATLPVAGDLKGAVVSAIGGLGGAGLTDDERDARLAEVEVRVLHWMKRNPVEAMGFLLNDPACAATDLPARLVTHVFRDVAAEDGVLKSVGWLVRDEVTFGTLCEVALDEIRAGGGFGLFEKLSVAIHRSSNRSAFRGFRAEPLVSENPAYDGESFLRLVGAAAGFEEKDRLLEMLRRLRGDDDKLELLAGFASSGGPAAGWVLGLMKSGELKGVLDEELLPDLEEVIGGVAGLDLETRLEILRKDPDTDVRPRQDRVNELAAADVSRFLETGRDWRFEFRHGKAAADDVLQAVRGGLPNLPEDAVRVTVYRELAEEDSKKALPLLQPFPPGKRREILLDSTWLSHVNVSPDDFLRFLADVPDAASPAEQERRLRGWNTNADLNLWRYGDDYVEWVKQLPPGIHREAAMNSVLRATSEQNPAVARALGEQFYPRKP